MNDEILIDLGVVSEETLGAEGEKRELDLTCFAAQIGPDC